MSEEQSEQKPEDQPERQEQEKPKEEAAPGPKEPEGPASSGQSAPPPRMGAPVAVAIVGGGIALFILILYLIARSQAYGIYEEMFEDEPLELKEVHRDTESGLIQMQREVLALAAEEQRSIELTTDMAVLLLAGGVFDLPAEPQKVRAEVKPVPASRIQVSLSIPLGEPADLPAPRQAGKYLNIRAVLRFDNPDPKSKKDEEKELRYHYESLRIGSKVDLVEELLIEAKGPVSMPLAIFDNWLDPPPERIVIEEDRLILDYTPLVGTAAANGAKAGAEAGIPPRAE